VVVTIQLDLVGGSCEAGNLLGRYSKKIILLSTFSGSVAKAGVFGGEGGGKGGGVYGKPRAQLGVVGCHVKLGGAAPDVLI
jgi:hypothetical protein